MTLSELVAEIDAQRQLGNLSSALRLFVLEEMMAGQALEHAKALENEARALLSPRWAIADGFNLKAGRFEHSI